MAIADAQGSWCRVSAKPQSPEWTTQSNERQQPIKHDSETEVARVHFQAPGKLYSIRFLIWNLATLPKAMNFGNRVRKTCGAMQGQTEQRWRALCERAIVERDPEKLLVLIEEINQLLLEKENRCSSRTSDRRLRATRRRRGAFGSSSFTCLTSRRLRVRHG